MVRRHAAAARRGSPLRVDGQEPLGDLYAVGEFGGSIVLGNVTLVSQGSLDAIVAKYSASGQINAQNNI